MKRRLFHLPLLCLVSATAFADDSIATTKAESFPEDPAKAMVAGIDQFLLRKLDQSAQTRVEYWRDAADVADNIEFLKTQLGLEATRYPSDPVVRHPALQNTPEWAIHAVDWPVLSHPAPAAVQSPEASAEIQWQPSLWGDGLLWLPAQPTGRCAVVLSHDGQPSLWDNEEGSVDANYKASVCNRLAEQGTIVLEIACLSHGQVQHNNATLSRREFIHRSAYELGRTLSGYEIQTLQSAIDWLGPLAQASAGAATDAAPSPATKQPHVLVAGMGEGGRTALLASVVDPRIDHVVVAGYFGPRDRIGKEPIERNIFGFLTRFDDARLAAALAPRQVTIQAWPEFSIEQSGQQGAAPASWHSPDAETVKNEFQQITTPWLDQTQSHCQLLEPDRDPAAIFPMLTEQPPMSSEDSETLSDLRQSLKQRASERRARRFAMLDRHNQAVLAESEYERGDFINLGHSRSIANNENNRLDTSSPEAYKQSIKRFRKIFRDEVIGWYDDPQLPISARSIARYHGEGWTGYDVMLDVFPDVFASGVLLMPDNIPAGKKLPVVVCQHGLEGRPQDTFLDDHRAYHDFAAKLAQSGFIVFAPQNPYIGKDAFRTLQRKSYPLGKTLFSIIAAQHQQIINWLREIPTVDGDRIAYYGLSYGGKSAMRLPALLPDYCLSICSGDFNDWVWKTASTRARYSYVGTGEYEIYEFGLGKTFNYAEMAALIAPRPFMVERGHYDGVGPDDRVAKEFAKVRFLYAARLKLPQRCEIEWFDGPHAIHAKGTFEFLRKHLQTNDKEAAGPPEQE